MRKDGVERTSGRTFLAPPLLTSSAPQHIRHNVLLERSKDLICGGAEKLSTGESMMMRNLARLFGAALVVYMSTVASAQAGPGKGIVRGTVLHDSLNTPVANAEVRLAPAGLSVRTDSLGAFSFTKVPTGAQRLSVKAVGFAAVEAMLTIPSAGLDSVEVGLTPTVTTLEKVDVTTKAVPRYLEDFESRRKMGIGRFLDSTALWTHGDPGQWYQRAVEQMPGVRLTKFGRTGRPSLAFAQRRGINSWRAANTDCYLRVFVDDQIMGDNEEPFDVTTWGGAPIVAAEYYTIAQLPARYNRLGSNTCGAILLWTRR